MSGPSDATQLRNLKRKHRELTDRFNEIEQRNVNLIRRATAADGHVRDWKRRFDALVQRDNAIADAILTIKSNTKKRGTNDQKENT